MLYAAVFLLVLFVAVAPVEDRCGALFRLAHVVDPLLADALALAAAGKLYAALAFAYAGGFVGAIPGDATAITGTCLVAVGA